jgi:hypothetical protein
LRRGEGGPGGEGQESEENRGLPADSLQWGLSVGLVGSATDWVSRNYSG